MGSAENIERVVEIVAAEIERNACAVVLSAMQGATDALIDVARAAERGDDSFRAKIKELEAKHETCARRLLGARLDAPPCKRLHSASFSAPPRGLR